MSETTRQTERIPGATVAIIGGGATGTGILRDLSMRGISAVLFEQGGLCHGTSSRFHGLLHSGGRYAVSDREAAAECVRENAILRRIGRQCVEPTEGFFALTAHDDESYVERWAKGCEAAGIPAVELGLDEAFELEPGLARDIRRVFRVPDAAVDGFRLVLHNAMSAERYGGRFYTYHEVLDIHLENGRVTGLLVRNAKTGEEFRIECEIVVNAAGSWSGRVAEKAGLHVPLTPDKGTLIVFNHRFTNHVVNRLHKSSDGDIFVPNGSVTILGTTSQTVEDPADTSCTTEESLRLLDLGRPLFPAIDSFRILRVFAGTRPLYTPGVAAGRSASRGFHISDHSSEGVDGLYTIFGGKLTTYRLMAEKMTDILAARLDVSAPCRTAEENLVADQEADDRRKAGDIFLAPALHLVEDRLGDDLAGCVREGSEYMTSHGKNPLVCECEMVSMAELTFVAKLPSVHSLHDVRLRTRLGMGTCQGTFCALRAASALVEAGVRFEDDALRDMRHFVGERWKGTRAVWWGQLAREMEFARSLYAGTLGTKPGEGRVPESLPRPVLSCNGPVPLTTRPRMSADVVVVGAGLAGLFAAYMAAADGARVALLSRGQGSLNISSGTIDVLGMTADGPVSGAPLAALERLPAFHPYRRLGTDAVKQALKAFRDLCEEEGWPLEAEEEGGEWQNMRLPTAIGTQKVSCLVPGSLDPRPLARARKVLVLGVDGLRDCMPAMAVDNLRRLPDFADKELVSAWLPSPWAGGYRVETALDVARTLERGPCEDFHRALARASKGCDCVLVPPIAGTNPDNAVYDGLVKAAGCPVVEMTGLPPGVTGQRLGKLLLNALRRRKVALLECAIVSGCERENGRVVALRTRHEDGERRHVADRFIVATGGTVAGGLVIEPGTARDAVLGLQFELPKETAEWALENPFATQPFAYLGMPVLDDLVPSLDGQTPLSPNIRYAGRAVAGQDPAFERSGNGIAIATAHAAAVMDWRQGELARS